MPRDSSGNYTLPVGNPVVDGTIISTDWANPTMSDIAVQLNNVVTRDGLLGPTDPFLILDGTEALPGIAFRAESDTGFWRPEANALAVSVNGDEVGRWTPDGYSGLVKNADPINIRNGAGFVGDGVHDDTDAIRSIHDYANSVNGTVSYAGVTKFAIQANARIQVNTSVDFAGAEVVPINGVGISSQTYIVADPACPHTFISGAVAAADLLQGSVFPTRGLFDGHGLAVLTAPYLIPNHGNTGTSNYRQSFKINRNGEASYGLSVDLSAFAASISLGFRKTSLKPLRISNLCLREDRTKWTQLQLIRVERCNVTFENFTLLPPDAPTSTYDNRDGIITFYRCSDIKIRNIVATGRPVTQQIGSYVLALNEVADVYVEKVNALTGWGAQYGENINGVHFTDCVIKRIDVHSSCHNLFVDKCKLGDDGGVQYGWGGGLLSVTRSVFHRTRAIVQARSDYGGQHFGTIAVDDCTYSFAGGAGGVFVELGNNQNIGSLYAPVQAPNILISNIRRDPSGTQANGVLTLFRVQAKTGAVVYAPRIITLRNVECGIGWTMFALFDWSNIEANPANPILRIVLENLHPPGITSSDRGLRGLSVRNVVTNPIDVRISVSDSDNVLVHSRYTGKMSITVSDSSVNAIDVDPASTTTRVELNNCRLTDPGLGYATAPIGGGAFAADDVYGSFTALRGCTISSPKFNLSRVAAFQGNLVRGMIPSLPAGVTPTQIFDGYRAPDIFVASVPSPTIEYLLAGPALPFGITFTRASKGTRFDAEGVLQDMAINAPRFDHDPSTLEQLGMIVEDTSTNSIPNNTMVGAAAPGTLPNGWVATNTQGLTREVVGTGVEDGIEYIDIRLFGVASSAAAIGIAQPLGSTTAPAVTGQRWIGSAFIRAVAGSFAGVTSVAIVLEDLRADGSSAGGAPVSVASDAVSLRTGRVAVGRTLVSSVTAFVGMKFVLTHPGAGEAIDLTIRIGLPQLELSNFATSVIKTVDAGAVVRAADVATVTGANFSAFWNPAEGTLNAVGLSFSATTGLTPCLAAASDGTVGNVVSLARINSTSKPQFSVIIGGVSQANLQPGTAAVNASFSVAGVYKVNDFAAAANGSAVLTDVSGAVPAVNRLHIGNLIGAEFLNGRVKSIRYWSTRLTDLQLQTLTTS